MRLIKFTIALMFSKPCHKPSSPGCLSLLINFTALAGWAFKKDAPAIVLVWTLICPASMRYLPAIQSHSQGWSPDLRQPAHHTGTFECYPVVLVLVDVDGGAWVISQLTPQVVGVSSGGEWWVVPGSLAATWECSQTDFTCRYSKQSRANILLPFSSKFIFCIPVQGREWEVSAV